MRTSVLIGFIYLGKSINSGYVISDQGAYVCAMALTMFTIMDLVDFFRS